MQEDRFWFASRKLAKEKMTSVIILGKFERVPLKDAWPTEDGNFTPWLAQAENVSLLGEALNMELEVEAVEHWVGQFRADILAKALDESDHRVLIENQFGRTNHNHLGQILTYLAGIEGAKTIVWIAEKIQEDHRAAIDWLNDNTVEDFSFFAIEIELWRISNSAPAPRFNVIASPNDWTKTARIAARQVGEPALAERHQVLIAYWASFSEFLKSRNSSFRIRRSNKDHWFEFPIGKAGIVISATVSTEKKRIGVELYNHNDANKTAFKQLLVQKDQIESEFGESLDWQELPGKKATRIVVFRNGVDPSDEKQLTDLHEWMLMRMDRFRKVFAVRVKSFASELVNPSENVHVGK